jgi:hypothetical protein
VSCLIPVSDIANEKISGPFELTKIAAQLPTEVSTPTKGAINPLDEKVKASYKGKGTFGVMGALIKNRGPTGLYAGVTYQLGAFSCHRLPNLVF